MRIHIPYISDQKIGGGYTFYRNFIRAMETYQPDIQFVPETEKHEILFAFAPTTINGETIERSKKAGAKFVLRMDGVPEDTRNSGRGTRRLVEYSLQADHIIYQSQFTRTTVGVLLAKNGITSANSIIMNGVDLETYKPDGEKINFGGKPNILHIAYRKDPNKRYEEVLAMYREYFSRNPKAKLLLLGRYPTEWMTYNMGFFNGENYQRLGIISDDATKAAMIRSCDFLFYPSFADPAPNAVIETIACGVPVLYNGYGGTAEIVGQGGFAIHYPTGFTEQISYMLENRERFASLAREQAQQFSLQTMSYRYRDAFERVLGI